MHNLILVEPNVPGSDEKGLQILLIANSRATSITSKALPSKKAGLPTQKFQTSFEPSQLKRACIVFSGPWPHKGQLPSVLTPLTFRFCIVARAFIQAHQAKILIFSGRLKCHTLFYSKDRESPAEDSPSLLVSTSERAT